mmetsp:Transcript_114344/g.318315  ORF Transcript_114344/g.318315 Transcript_114344/m.318315 type:complete len:345 (+) Transcript_114344:1122-2156(+)
MGAPKNEFTISTLFDISLLGLISFTVIGFPVEGNVASIFPTASPCTSVAAAAMSAATCTTEASGQSVMIGRPCSWGWKVDCRLVAKLAVRERCRWAVSSRRAVLIWPWASAFSSDVALNALEVATDADTMRLGQGLFTTVFTARSDTTPRVLMRTTPLPRSLPEPRLEVEAPLPTRDLAAPCLVGEGPSTQWTERLEPAVLGMGLLPPGQRGLFACAEWSLGACCGLACVKELCRTMSCGTWSRLLAEGLVARPVARELCRWMVSDGWIFWAEGGPCARELCRVTASSAPSARLCADGVWNPGPRCASTVMGLLWRRHTSGGSIGDAARQGGLRNDLCDCCRWT